MLLGNQSGGMISFSANTSQSKLYLAIEKFVGGIGGQLLPNTEYRRFRILFGSARTPSIGCVKLTLFSV